MSTIAIVGAGPGLGLSIAKVFGGHGFDVALVARSQDKLDALVAQLDALGVSAAGFVADVLDRPSLERAFVAIKERFGTVDVLEYSPAPHTPVPGITIVGPLDVTVENVQPQLDYYVHGAITSARQVLPEMLASGSGTLMFTTGASSLHPFPIMGNVGIAGAALRNWVLNLHTVLADTGVYAVHIPLAVFMGQGGPESEPDTIAEMYWDLHTKREEPERFYDALGMSG
jgi:NADP-dependent 3-hydroxy acid dehydrogenase YdfG